MEQKIEFEKSLYGDEVGTNYEVFDAEFFVDRIIAFPAFRPLQLDRVVSLCVEYCKNADFRRKLLDCSLKCPILIYKLYKEGVFVFDEIEAHMESSESFLFCYYYRKEIKDFESFILDKSKPKDFDESFINDENVDQYLDYGFVPSTIEYCLKYDDIEVFRNLNSLNQEAKWSPFEWSRKPDYFDLLSFSGFFGSLKCFRHLLLNEHVINAKVISSVVCSGSIDLFNLFTEKNMFTSENICKSSEFFQLSILAFFHENPVNIELKGDNNETPLHYSAREGHLSVVEYLVNHRADINAENNTNTSPLHHSAGNGHLSVVEYLINHGANINAKDNEILFKCFYYHHFIFQQLMAILVLLNA